jgi:ATP-dependent DNA helicase RecG
MPVSAEESPLDKQVRYLKGVGPKRAEALAGLGVHTVRDLLVHLPREYEDRRRARPLAQVRVGESAVIAGTISRVDYRRGRRRGLGILEVEVDDDTGVLLLVWFHARHSWASSFPLGQSITAYGTVRFYGGLQMVAPDYEVGVPPGESTKFGCMLPVYPASEQVSQRTLRTLVARALEQSEGTVAEALPVAVTSAADLPGADWALRHVHFPADPEGAGRARRRLAYEELFVSQTALALRRRALRRQEGTQFKVGPNVDRRIRRLFPFRFTRAQERVIGDVTEDLTQPRPMNRLLQGDVGCGKTVVAVYALLAALAESREGRQAALMAPTEILAEQHYLTLESLLRKARLRISLMTSSLSPPERRQTLASLAAGELDLVVGTHALIQPDVEFRNLALVVMDEQHRFGVRQRLALRRKGRPPEVLIMTATPIPRTLALSCFADMDVSVIDEMPPGRQPVTTELCRPPQWARAYDFARSELQQGRSVFVVYPLVEENRDLDLTSATQGYEELRSRAFPGYECCLLHGQMAPAEKRRVMEEFRAGKYQVMAATTVVEVGIDVPQATVMIVQHAERLGLAQLHQLRGRIGRGRWAGRCFLLADPTTEQARLRLSVLCETNDGFRIAQEDLRIRGPGQFFGTEQSGLPEFRCYDFSDLSLLERARDDAFALVARDPRLTAAEHAGLRRRVMDEYGARLVFAEIA